MEVEVICKEIVKPSSPTPNSLSILKLPLFSQVGVPILMPIIFFYSKATMINLNHHLKHSLAHTLTHYYPLAGRINLSSTPVVVACNDEGVPYVETRVKQSLHHVIYKAELAQLDVLLPHHDKVLTDLILAVQVNFFACGGVAIGVRMNSKVSDAFSLFMFVKAWAACSSTSNFASSMKIIPRPCFDISKLFPPLPYKPTRTPISKVPKDVFVERIRSKRFVFDHEKLRALRSKYCRSGTDYSLAMVLSAFIWKCANKSNKNINNCEVFNLVNVRPRMMSSSTKYGSSKYFYFGKMAVRAMAKPQLLLDTNEVEPFVGLMRGMKKSMAKIDTSFLDEIRTSRGAEEFMCFQDNFSQRAMKGEIVSLGFSSLRSLPVYDADFGWGKPAWVTSATLPMKNFVIFISSPSGKEIEVYITLSDEDMARLENDPEFDALSCTSAPVAACKL